LNLREAIEAEAQAQAICMAHPDFREAYDAWVQKRPPRFER
jgi:enoyl-CoA hydratase/carnithine racemase